MNTLYRKASSLPTRIFIGAVSRIKKVSNQFKFAYEIWVEKNRYGFGMGSEWFFYKRFSMIGAYGFANNNITVGFRMITKKLQLQYGLNLQNTLLGFPQQLSISYIFK
jgi:hypothetical protein